LIKEIKKNSLDLFNKNLKEMDIYLIRYDKNIGIIRCNNINKENVIKILNSINNISSKNLRIITFGTSGTIKGLVNKNMNKIDKFHKENNNNHLK